MGVGAEAHAGQPAEGGKPADGRPALEVKRLTAEEAVTDPNPNPNPYPYPTPTPSPFYPPSPTPSPRASPSLDPNPHLSPKSAQVARAAEEGLALVRSSGNKSGYLGVWVDEASRWLSTL